VCVCVCVCVRARVFFSLAEVSWWALVLRASAELGLFVFLWTGSCSS
jgi:hypothetical protein